MIRSSPDGLRVARADWERERSEARAFAPDGFREVLVCTDEGGLRRLCVCARLPRLQVLWLLLGSSKHYCNFGKASRWGELGDSLLPTLALVCFCSEDVCVATQEQASEDFLVFHGVNSLVKAVMLRLNEVSFAWLGGDCALQVCVANACRVLWWLHCGMMCESVCCDG